MNIIEFQKHIHLKPPSVLFPSLYILSTWMFIFGLSLLGSKFIFSPGIDITLPVVPELSLQYTSSVLTIGKNDLLIFNDQILTYDELYDEFKSFISNHPKRYYYAMLVRIDSEISIQKFLDIAQIAKDAGFSKIHIAAEKFRLSNN